LFVKNILDLKLDAMLIILLINIVKAKFGCELHQSFFVKVREYPGSKSLPMKPLQGFITFRFTA